MKKERGEIVTGVMVVMMACMLIFGIFSMHGMHGSHGNHGAGNSDQQMQHSDSDHRQMHGAEEQEPAPAEDGNK